MSELFPELDEEICKRLLRGHIPLESEDETIVASVLKDMGLIIIRSKQYLRCAFEGDPDLYERRNLACEGIIVLDGDSEPMYCPECGRPVENPETKTVFEKNESIVLPDGVTQYIENALRSVPTSTKVERLDDGVLQVVVNDERPLTLMTLDYARPEYKFPGIYFSEPTIYVIVSSNHIPVTHVLEELFFLPLWEILSRPPEWMASRLEDASYPLPNRISFTELNTRFENMLYQQNGWQYFEQTFMPEFFKRIAENGQLIDGYIGELRRASRTIMDSYFVPIGGAGRTDMRSISKFELMNELFSAGRIADAKRLVKSQLEQDDVSKILLHLETDPQRPVGAIVVLSSEKVRSTAWEAVMQLRQNAGYWKIIVLTKHMILELLARFQATDLMD